MTGYLYQKKSRYQIKVAGLLTLVVITAAFLVHWRTLASMTSIWANSDTFSHGFLIFPISLFLVWRRRSRLAELAPAPSVWGLFAIALISFLWLLAGATSIRVLQQYAVVGFVPALVWCILGKQIVSEMKFPLFFLAFAVPAGEVLIPCLMNFTAAFTVKAVQLTGVPVHRDGLFFSIPSGDFEVAKACSGVRYLIASVVMGTLYAYLVYRSFWRRAIFICVAILVPIMANGLRAYGIVMIAHLTNMRLAAGLDHIIYGWLFFGIVMLLLFWLGNYFRENNDDREVEHAARHCRQVGRSLGRVLSMAIAAMTIIIVGSVVASYLSEVRQPGISLYDFALPRGVGAWQGPVSTETVWRPQVAGADLEISGRYRKAQHEVDVFVFRYTRQGQDSEMVNSENRVYDGKHWFLMQEYKEEVLLNNGLSLDVIATGIRSPENNRLVWHWYNVSGRSTASRIMAKLYEARGVLSAKNLGSYMVAISTQQNDDSRLAHNVLQEFMAENYGPLKSCLSGAELTSDICSGKQRTE